MATYTYVAALRADDGLAVEWVNVTRFEDGVATCPRLNLDITMLAAIAEGLYGEDLRLVTEAGWDPDAVADAVRAAFHRDYAEFVAVTNR